LNKTLIIPVCSYKPQRNGVKSAFSAVLSVSGQIYMQTIRQALEARVSAAIASVTGLDQPQAHVIHATRPEFGDYQANGVMAVAKREKTNPRELATRVVASLDPGDIIARAEVAGPGFINLFLNDEYLLKQARAAADEPSRLIVLADRAETVVVDYSSPNLAKEMHVGHLRGTIIGDAIVRVLQALGHKVIRQNHVGDWGTQFGMLIAHMESLQEKNKTLSTELSDLEVFYRAAKQRFDAEPEFADKARAYVVRLQQGDSHCQAMWQRFIDESLQHCESVYKRLGVLLTRDDLCAESFYNNELANIVDILDENGLLTESDGAKCVFLDQFTGKDNKPLPAIIQKRDGGYLYASTDLAAIRYRCQTLKADRVLYVVDARQNLHFQQVFAIAKLAGFAPESCALEHIAYGTMMGKDGRPFKTRSGDTVKLSDLLDEAARRAQALVEEKNPDLGVEEKANIGQTVGIGAVKYADLSKNRNSDYIFDWSSMLSFDGNTAPYLLYACARIRSILRKQTSENPEQSELLTEIAAEQERALTLKILQFPETVQMVGNDCLPNHLCLYLFELAGVFMRFYENCPILSAETDIQKASRLALARLTVTTLDTGLGLLGIRTLERM